jgi:hypothetical protein
VTPRARVVLLEAAVVTIASTALAIVITWPLLTDFDDRIYGYPGDSTGTISFLWASAHKTGYHLLGSTHITLTGAPFGWDFANALNVQWGYVLGTSVLVTKIFGEIPAYNLNVLSGLALSAAFMYLLVRRIGGAPLVAAWAGLAYTIFPWHVEKAQGHVAFVHLEGFPLLVLAVLAWHSRPDGRRAVAVAGATLLLWTTVGYFGLASLVALAVLLSAAALVQRRSVGGLVALRRLLLVGGLSLAVPVAIFASSVLAPGAEGIPGARDAGSLHTYGARPWEFFLPSYRSSFFGDDVGPYLFGHLHGSNFSETSLYVGWVPLLLAAGFLVFAALRWRQLSSQQRLLAGVLPVLGVVALLFSLPSPLPRTNIPGPSRLLWEIAPQFRVPARFVALVMTALVPLAALGLEAFRRRLAAAPVWGPAAAVTICVAAGVGTTTEFWLDAHTTDLDQTPAYYRTVEAAPKGILAEYPLAKAEQAVNSDYLFWQRVHRRPLVNGAAEKTFAEAAGQSVIDPNSPETSSELAALGVTAVVVRPTTYAFSGGKPGPTKLNHGYRLLKQFPDGVSVWRVVARAAPAISTFTDGFSFAETPVGQPTSRWMIEPEATVDLYAWRAGTYRVRFQIASYGRPRVVGVAGQGESSRVFGVLAPRVVTFPVTLPRGRSRIELSARPGPEPVPDGRRVTVYVSNWQFLPFKPGGGPAIGAIPE